MQVQLAAVQVQVQALPAPSDGTCVTPWGRQGGGQQGARALTVAASTVAPIGSGLPARGAPKAPGAAGCPLGAAHTELDALALGRSVGVGRRTDAPAGSSCNAALLMALLLPLLLLLLLLGLECQGLQGGGQVQVQVGVALARVPLSILAAQQWQAAATDVEGGAVAWGWVCGMGQCTRACKLGMRACVRACFVLQRYSRERAAPAAAAAGGGGAAAGCAAAAAQPGRVVQCGAHLDRVDACVQPAPRVAGGVHPALRQNLMWGVGRGRRRPTS